MARPFIFRIHAAELFAQIQPLNDDEKAAFVTQFSIDLLTLNGTSDYSKTIIADTMKLIESKRENGKKGGRPKTETKAKVKLNKSKPKANTKQEEEEEEEEEVKKEKKEYAEKVFMTDDQYLKLLETHGNQKTARFIEKLSIAKCANNKMKYDSDYHAILKWVISAVEKDGVIPTLFSEPAPGTPERTEWLQKQFRNSL